MPQPKLSPLENFLGLIIHESDDYEESLRNLAERRSKDELSAICLEARTLVDKGNMEEINSKFYDFGGFFFLPPEGALQAMSELADYVCKLSG